VSSRYRKKPLAQLERGTRIYSPSASEPRFRVVASDPVSGERVFVKCRTEEGARAKARELEQFIAQSAAIRDATDAGPRTVDRLAQRYIEDHLSGLSVRFREKQTYLLRRWVLPCVALGREPPQPSGVGHERPHRPADVLHESVGTAGRPHGGDHRRGVGGGP